MLTFEVDLAGLQAAASKADSGDVLAAMNNRVRLHGDRWLTEIDKNVKRFAPDATRGAGATGGLVNSIIVDPMRAEGQGSALVEWRGEVFSSLPHAIVMERGRKAGAAGPPSSALIPWVERAIRFGNIKVEGVRTPAVVPGARKVRGRVARKPMRFRKKEEAVIRSLAFLIARSIHRKGWPNPAGRGRRRPYRMFAKGLKASEQFVQADVGVLLRELTAIAAGGFTGRAI